MNRSLWAVSVVALAVVAATACGSSDSEPGSVGGSSGADASAGAAGVAGTSGAAGSGGTTANGGTAGSGGTVATGGTAGAGGTSQDPCPADLPSGSCTTASLLCWYGADPRWFCKTAVLCNNNSWEPYAQPLAGCTGEPQAACPADPANPTPGICDPDTGADPECLYEGNKYCLCGFQGGPYYTWVCADPPAQGCPAIPPNAGTPCDGQTTCLYGPSCSGRRMQCEGGLWKHVNNPPC